jgi:DNA-binding NarL/FixJ family response regulator
MVANNQVSALIVAKPSPLQVGLRALLVAMPQIGIVQEIDDLGAAIQIELRPQPILVLLDGDVSGEIEVAMRRGRLRWPQARFVFLANDVQQEKRASDARADAVLIKGSPPARLVAVLVRLLGRPEQHKEESSTIDVSVRPRGGWQPRLGQLVTKVRGQG